MIWKELIRDSGEMLIWSFNNLSDKDLALKADSIGDALKHYAKHLYAQQAREPIKVIDTHVA